MSIRENRRSSRIELSPHTRCRCDTGAAVIVMSGLLERNSSTPRPSLLSTAFEQERPTPRREGHSADREVPAFVGPNRPENGAGFFYVAQTGSRPAKIVARLASNLGLSNPLR